MAYITRQDDPLTYDVSLRDDHGVPVATVRNVGAGHPHAHHPLAGTRLKANVYFDGSVRLFSAEFGSRFFNPAPFHPRFKRPKLIFKDGREVEIDLNRMDGVERHLDLGVITASAHLPEGMLRLTAVIPELFAREILIAYEWTGGGNAPRIVWPVNVPDFEPDVEGSSIRFAAGAYGTLTYLASGGAKTTGAAFDADLSKPFVIRAGYSTDGTAAVAPTLDEVHAAARAAHTFWRDRLSKLKTSVRGPDLLELQWATALLVKTCIWDGLRNQLACTNGHLYSFDHLTEKLDQAAHAYTYSFRDGNEVAFALVDLFPEIARQQVLRNFGAFDRAKGIPQASHATPGSGHLYKTPTAEWTTVKGSEFASDQVWWVIKLITEYVRRTDEYALLDEVVADAHGNKLTIRAHLDEMLKFGDETVGYGPNGLCRFLSGDWNDFTGEIGRLGRGESFMNTALAIIAKSRLAWVDEKTGRIDSAKKLRSEAETLRSRIDPFLKDAKWYPRAINDEAKLIGTDRIFTEAQGFLALAKCGSPEFRRRAVVEVAKRTTCAIGTLIMDRPLAGDDYTGVSPFTQYAPGTGENGGLWWLTGYWLAIALEQEGEIDEAWRVYRANSLLNHHHHFPGEWWSPLMSPDGIDGPASPHYGKAQQPPGFAREQNPNEVVKYAYQLYFATRRGADAAMCW